MGNADPAVLRGRVDPKARPARTRGINWPFLGALLVNCLLWTCLVVALQNLIKGL